jgi:hypothetical protein
MINSAVPASNQTSIIAIRQRKRKRVAPLFGEGGGETRLNHGPPAGAKPVGHWFAIMTRTWSKHCATILTEF